MKVLVITNMYPSPDMPFFGTFVKDQVESLRVEGVDIDILFVNGVKNTFGIASGVDYHSFSCYFRADDVAVS